MLHSVRRVLEEGGYESRGLTLVLRRPARLSTNTEDLSSRRSTGCSKIFLLIRKRRVSAGNRRAALASFHTKAEFTIEAVAPSRSLIARRIDWGSDGRLWVCEMYDYPAGLDGKWKPGGR